MTLFRSILFNLAFYAWTAFLGVVALPMVLAPRAAVMRFGRWWSGTVLDLARALAGIDYELRGAEHLPREPAIIAMKHQSAWDTLGVPALFGDVAIVLKRELLWIPFYGWYARKAGMVPVDRGAGASALKQMVREAMALFARGRQVVIFPEGHRGRPGVAGDYKPGVAALYRELDVPVHPVATNSGVHWPAHGFMRKPGVIVYEYLEPIPPGLKRAEFMRVLQERIETASNRLLTL